MVLLIDGTPLSDIPQSIAQLFYSYPSLKDNIQMIFPSFHEKAVDPRKSVYVTQREYAVWSSSSPAGVILGTDCLVNNTALILKCKKTGSCLLSQVDKLTSSDLDEMITSLQCQVQPLQNHNQDEISVSLIGAFSDSKNISQSLLVQILSAIHYHKRYFGIDIFCVGEMATEMRDDIRLPKISGVGIDTKSGDIFPAVFSDKGPDMDLRIARTLCTGDNESKIPGMLNVYDCNRGQMIVGPFTYSPMRAVDIWLQQSDQFLLQSLSPCPEAVQDPQAFVRRLRNSLNLVRAHPYPSVTIFPANQSRTYSREATGAWVLHNQKPTSTSDWYIPNQSHTVKAEYNLSYKMDPSISYPVKHEVNPWSGSRNMYQMNYY